MSESAKVFKMDSRPRSFTENERLIEEVREAIFSSKRTYQQIAAACSISNSTVANLATGKTIWPRPKTLFPLIDFLGLRMVLVKK